MSNEQKQKYTDVYEQLSLVNSGNNFACMGVSSDTKQMLVAPAKVVNDNQAKVSNHSTQNPVMVSQYLTWAK